MGQGILSEDVLFWGPNTGRACWPRQHAAYRLASPQRERAGGQGTQGGEHLTHRGGVGSRAFARYEVVGERMSKPADASHISISSPALSPELWAYKSNCLLPRPAPLVSTPPKLLPVIPQRLCPFLAQAESHNDILDSPISLTAYIQSFRKLYLPFFCTPESDYVTVKCHQ